MKPAANLSYTLHKIMARLELICDNCHSKDCLDGKAVTQENIVEGAKVTEISGGHNTIAWTTMEYNCKQDNTIQLHLTPVDCS